MAVGASKPTVVADADGFFTVKSKMLVSFLSHVKTLHFDKLVLMVRIIIKEIRLEFLKNQLYYFF